MNLRNFQDDELLTKTKALVSEERRVGVEIFHHLREIYRRRLHLTRGYPSIFAYATDGLGYSAAAAQRRVSAMYLIMEMPEVEGKIKSGELNLTNAAQAQRMFHLESKAGAPVPLEIKKEILSSIENKSTREAERELMERSTQPIAIQKKDRISPVTLSLSEFKFLASSELVDQLEQIKALLSHRNPTMSLGELVAEMAKISLEKLTPKSPKLKTASKSVSDDKESGAGVTLPSAEHTRYIPVDVRRAVYERDGGVCQYQDPSTGRKCGSRNRLELDHIRSFALGGASTAENLRLACRAHNQVHALVAFGSKHMSRFLCRQS